MMRRKNICHGEEEIQDNDIALPYGYESEVAQIRGEANFLVTLRSAMSRLTHSYYLFETLAQTRKRFCCLLLFHEEVLLENYM